MDDNQARSGMVKIAPEIHALIKAYAKRNRQTIQVVVDEILKTGLKVKKLLVEHEQAA